MRSDGQASFRDIEQASKKVTRRGRFLARLEKLPALASLVTLVEPCYPTSGCTKFSYGLFRCVQACQYLHINESG